MDECQEEEQVKSVLVESLCKEAKWIWLVNFCGFIQFVSRSMKSQRRYRNPDFIHEKQILHLLVFY